MDVGDDHPPASPPLESREPTRQDLVDLCRRLNAEAAEYVVVGGFAMQAAGYGRRTMDIDLLIAVGPENEARVFRALESLPDQAVRELQPGEVARYSVVRVADEIVVDLMTSASGVAYADAAQGIVVHEVDVPAETIGTYDTGLTEDFIRALATTAEMTLHVRLRSGRSPHHVVEAEFKALATCLGDATRVDGAAIPSTKGTL